MDVLIDHLPAPETDPDHPLQAWVTSLDATRFVGRLAMCRNRCQGTIRKGQEIAWCARGREHHQQRLGVLYVTENHERVEVEQAGPESCRGGRTAGRDHRRDPADPGQTRPLPVISMDEPSLAMTIGVNTSPLAGATESCSRAPDQGRLDAELVGNVGAFCRPSDPTPGRCTPRRAPAGRAGGDDAQEGFELTVGKPQVVCEIDGTIHEPVEAVSIDVPEEYLGAVSQLLATRGGQLVNMVNPRHRMGPYRPAGPGEGLLGFRTDFLTETRGTGMIHSVFDGWAPWFGEIRTRDRGSVVADRRGRSRRIRSWPCRSVRPSSLLLPRRPTRAWSWVRTPVRRTWM